MREWFEPIWSKIGPYFAHFLSRLLTATNENTWPEPMDAMFEEVQLIDVAGNSMIEVVTRYHLPYSHAPTFFDHAIMHPALKFNLDIFELLAAIRFCAVIRHTVKVLVLVPLPTVVSKAQEVEGLRFSLAALLSVTGRIASELD